MSFFSPAYTPESTATILNGQPNDATPVKDGFDTLNTFTGIIDDQRALTEQTSTINLVANRDIFVPVNCAGGAVTVTLPSGVDHTTQPIVITKLGADYNVLTIGLQGGSDRIDSPWSSLATPVLTTLTFRLPGTRIALFPIFKSGVYYWRICSFNEAELYWLTEANVYPTSNQTSSTSGAEVTMGTEATDLASWFSANRYTPQIPGRYFVEAAVSFTPGSTSNMWGSIAKNNAEIKRIGQFEGTVNFQTVGSWVVAMNGSTDYISLRAQTLTNTRTIDTAGGVTTYMRCQLIARTA